MDSLFYANVFAENSEICMQKSEKEKGEKLKKYETKDQSTKGYKFLNLLDFLRGFIGKEKNYKHRDFLPYRLFSLFPLSVPRILTRPN
jgi:hypothetical protein